MSRRSLTLLVAGIGAAVLAMTGALFSVPYVVLSPGPTVNTLGTNQNGKPLIAITGHPVYPTTGHLNLVTVSFQGGPDSEINLFTALRAWLSPHDAVVPQEEVFGNTTDVRQVQQQNVQEMTDSQQLATAAALRELKIGFKTQVVVAQTVKGMPAYGVLRAGDVIVAVDGTAVTGAARSASLIRDRRAGSPVRLTVSSLGHVRQVLLTTTSQSGHAAVGIIVAERFKFPFNVTISVGDIGGPSAGMMFALGLIDKLSAGDLAGGRFIAGTGEIDAAGNVGPIGGIQQKMVGAHDQGATIFLAPAGNCTDVRGAVPPGLRVVKVSTLAGAVADLEALKAGKPVPSC
jgi:PDZ domain-containing protein